MRSRTVNSSDGQAASAAAQLELAGPLRLGRGGRLGSNGFLVSVLGAANTTYVLEASTNLQLWVPLATNFTATGLWDFVDPAATNFPNRYYRVRPH